MICTLPLAMFWRPYFPPTLTLAATAVLIGLSVWSYSRSTLQKPTLGAFTLTMRIILIAAVTTLLMGPSIMQAGSAYMNRPVLRILLDSSASMQTADVEQQPRYDFARTHWLTPDWLEQLREDYDVQLFTFDRSLRSITDDVLQQPGETVSTADVSNIAQSVSDSLIETVPPGSVMLIFSDGRDTLNAPMHPVGQLARSRACPIYTVPLGGPGMARDLAVVAVPRQPYLFAEEPGSITVSVMRSNIGQENMFVHVQQGDNLQTLPITFNGKDTAAIDVPIVHNEPGTYDYRVWADPIPGEVDDNNNTQPVFVEVTAKRLRVLLLEGQPYWDTKFLAHALRKDARIELTQITQITPDKREAIVSLYGTSAELPQTLEDLGRYDIIILGQSIANVLSEDTIALLPDYVSQHGGRLVFARGRAYDPELDEDQQTASVLSSVEPVIFGQGSLHNQQLDLEPIGMLQPPPSHDQSIDSPTLINIPVVIREKAAARVLARTRPKGIAHNQTQGQPAIVTMPYGRGMVVSILGEGLWRWALRPRRSDQTNDTFDRFWMDSVRWLALGSDFKPGVPISLRLSRLGVQIGDPIQLDLISRSGFDSIDPLVVVEAPDGSRSTVELAPVPGVTTRRRAELHPDMPGVYTVTAHAPDAPGQSMRAQFNCYHIDIERMHTSANRSALRTLSETSGGRCLNADDPDEFFKLLDKQQQAMQTPPKPVYAWNHGWIMSLILSWAGVEWILRRAGGLL